MTADRRTPNAILQAAMTAAALRPRHRETRMPIGICNVQRATARLERTGTSLGRPLYNVHLDIVGPCGERTTIVLRVDPRHASWAKRFVRLTNLANLEPSALPATDRARLAAE
ncbi:hypothetical protein RHODGE_RHODGE_00992 [Rhodoplanes serenus]|uniref:Uncharacterized protein n=1 Tax=Rhodoplanes serenus TaxID=200615 RepID=A0A3S4BT02_9BRAD|nr:hypothetical protein [Rhodoplanes serenus]VCU06619.1 hypothetical protein RHODPL_RHODPL_00067 [Rhodoplanes serenus]VCU07842.1 hypothetical protein RHODGE_RHODGE_00992 [Rhodoplanes serenus]